MDADIEALDPWMDGGPCARLAAWLEREAMPRPDGRPVQTVLISIDQYEPEGARP